MDEKGDVLQWGNHYDPAAKGPEITLAGKNVQTVETSADRIIALSKDGTVYSLPKAKADQRNGTKSFEPTWIPFMSSPAPISYKTIKIPASYFER